MSIGRILVLGPDVGRELARLETAGYEVTVVDETGMTVWKADARASPVDYGTPAGTGTVTATITAPQTLTAGTYQVRVVAYNVKDEIISTSEDLLGVFTVQ